MQEDYLRACHKLFSLSGKGDVLLALAHSLQTWTCGVVGRAMTYAHYIGFEVLTAVVMKSSIFWDITPCSLLKVNRHFGGTSSPSTRSKIKLSKKPV
jgi:hypothetical protein